MAKAKPKASVFLDMVNLFQYRRREISLEDRMDQYQSNLKMITGYIQHNFSPVIKYGYYHFRYYDNDEVSIIEESVESTENFGFELWENRKDSDPVIVTHCMDYAWENPEIKNIVLILGDSDYVEMVKSLARRDYMVTCIYPADAQDLSWELRDTVQNFVSVEDIRRLHEVIFDLAVEEKNQKHGCLSHFLTVEIMDRYYDKKLRPNVLMNWRDEGILIDPEINISIAYKLNRGHPLVSAILKDKDPLQLFT